MTDDEKLAGDRVDLIKRLFAVTISVGFVTRFSGIVFNSSYITGSDLNIVRLFTDHWRDGVLLIIAMIAVVLSWESYLRAIYKDPLEDRPGFYIDILLVVTYLALMLSSQYFISGFIFW